MDVEDLFLGIADVCEALNGTPSSRNFVEGEDILRSKHLILCEASKKTSSEVHVYALCLQTSALDSQPHTIEGMLKFDTKKKVIVKTITCTCKAGDGQRCKHIAAALLYCNRFY